MASAKRDIRHIIDSFSEDLIEIAKDVVSEHVERAVSEWQAKQAKTDKLLLRKSAENEKALRNQKALERIERVALRRREREEKKATERALRLEQRVVEGKKPRAPRSTFTEPSANKEPAPPPLFVHKRRRDGEIEQLKRNDESEAAGLNGTAGAAVASVGSVASVAP